VNFDIAHSISNIATVTATSELNLASAQPQPIALYQETSFASSFSHANHTLETWSHASVDRKFYPRLGAVRSQIPEATEATIDIWN
jgi:hypothetical protein